MESSILWYNESNLQKRPRGGGTPEGMTPKELASMYEKHTASSSSEPSSDIPYGYCQCGCGQKTGIATNTNRQWGHVRGEPYRYLHGHHRRRFENPHEHLGDGTTRIFLPSGYTTLIDTNRWDEIRRYRWTAHKRKSGHVYVQAHPPGDSRRSIQLHRLLMDNPKGRLVDHHNGDTLDNRDDNLRVATTTQNALNQTIKRNNTSGYKGVIFSKPADAWIAVINLHGKKRRLGTFLTPEDAARAYDVAARELHGEFATLNFPRDGERGAR